MRSARSPHCEYNESGELTNLTPANCCSAAARQGAPWSWSATILPVRGGSADASISTKSAYGEEMAHDFRLPIIRMIEGSAAAARSRHRDQGAANLPAHRRHRRTGNNRQHGPCAVVGWGSARRSLGAARRRQHYAV